MTPNLSRSESTASFSSAETATLAGTPEPPTFLSPTTAQNRIQESLPQFIPPDHPDRTLVLCFDGTGDQFDSDNSNIVELFSMLKKDVPSKQLVYYQAGIGTYTTPQFSTFLFAKFSQVVDEAVAWNLDSHIMGGYEFLMQNYRVRDKICIFGFSRGAYTARCLAGMLHKVGLLPPSNHQQIPFAYTMYTRTDEIGWKQSDAFKKAFSIEVEVRFLGVWDTVSSVGFIPRRLPFTTSNTVVRTFRHALALDERRWKFEPNTWNCPTEGEALLSRGVTHRDREIGIEIGLRGLEKGRKGMGDKDKNDKNARRWVWEDFENLKYGNAGRPETDIEEVWFAGSHCDVGGGSVPNGVKPCLSRIPLRWMVRECFKSNTGIIFHTKGLCGIGMNPATLYPVVIPRPPALPLDMSSPLTCLVWGVPKVQQTQVAERGKEPTIDSLLLMETETETETETEEEAERKDALAPIYDQLELGWGWWVLEFVPFGLGYRCPRRGGGGVSSWMGWVWPGVSMGEGRRIPGRDCLGVGVEVKVHRSVRTRMEAGVEVGGGKDGGGGGRYWPRADLELGCVCWVD